MQFTGKNSGWLGGIDEAIALLKLCADDWSALTVNALYEGDFYDDWDTVLTVEGPYEAFAHLETLCLGALRRRTKICTNAKLITNAARAKPVIFFGARDDVFWTQAGDGYAAMAGGVKSVSTDAQASLFGGKSVGTIPHALIAAFGGDTVKATKRFAELVHPMSTSSRCRLRQRLREDVDRRRAGARGTTVGRAARHRREHGGQVDRAADGQLQADRRERAARVERAQRARRRGFGEVKIIVSGGFDVARITDFEEDGVPVDAYGVGAALFDGRFDFTADIVQVNGKPQSKAGRKLRENSRLERVK